MKNVLTGRPIERSWSDILEEDYALSTPARRGRFADILGFSDSKDLEDSVHSNMNPFDDESKHYWKEIRYWVLGVI